MAKKQTPTNARGARLIDFEVGNRIRALRLDRGMSQEQVADALGVSFQQVQKYEKGVNRLSVGRLVEMSELFKCNPTEIVGWGSKSMGPTINVETFKLARAFDALRDDLKGPVRALIMKLIDAEIG